MIFLDRKKNIVWIGRINFGDLTIFIGEACHTVHSIKYARKDHRSNSKDIKTKGIKGQRKKGEIEINTNKYLGNIN